MNAIFEACRVYTYCATVHNSKQMYKFERISKNKKKMHCAINAYLMAFNAFYECQRCVGLSRIQNHCDCFFFVCVL